MSKRGERIQPVGTFFDGGFGTVNVSHNVNIVDEELIVRASLLEDHERLQRVETRLDVIEKQITAMVQHINDMNRMMQAMWYAPGMPGFELGEQSFEIARGSLSEETNNIDSKILPDSTAEQTP